MKITDSVDIRPISINKCWQGHKFMTGEYKTWREEMYYLLRQHKKVPKEKGSYKIHLTFYIYNFLKCDLDNFVKPVLDSFVENGIIKDDRYVTQLILEKIKIDKTEKEFFIYEIENI